MLLSILSRGDARIVQFLLRECSKDFVLGFTGGRSYPTFPTMLGADMFAVQASTRESPLSAALCAPHVGGPYVAAFLDAGLNPNTPLSSVRRDISLVSVPDYIFIPGFSCLQPPHLRPLVPLAVVLKHNAQHGAATARVLLERGADPYLLGRAVWLGHSLDAEAADRRLSPPLASPPPALAVVLEALAARQLAAALAAAERRMGGGALVPLPFELWEGIAAFLFPRFRLPGRR